MLAFLFCSHCVLRNSHLFDLIAQLLLLALQAHSHLGNLAIGQPDSSLRSLVELNGLHHFLSLNLSLFLSVHQVSREHTDSDLLLGLLDFLTDFLVLLLLDDLVVDPHHSLHVSLNEVFRVLCQSALDGLLLLLLMLVGDPVLKLFCLDARLYVLEPLHFELWLIFK